MHIAVHLTRIDLQMQNNGSVPARLKHLAVSLAQTGGKEAAVHRATVDEKELSAAVRARHAGTRDKSVDADTVALERRDLEKLRAILRAEKVAGPRSKRGGRQPVDLASVAKVDQSDRRKGQRDIFDRAVEVGRLGRGAAQEFFPRGHVEEKRFDLDRRSDRATRIARRDQFAAAQHGFGPGTCAFGSRAQGEFGNTGDARQRLAAESHGLHGGEIGSRHDFARGVAFERHERILAIHARTVVGHAQERRARTPHLDLDA